MNKWLLLILGIVSILLLSYLSFSKKSTIIREDLLNKAEIIRQNPAFKDVYVKLKGEDFSLTRELMLLGTVSSKEERALASNLLQDIKGVTKVNNLLKIQTLKPIIKEVIQEKQTIEIPITEVVEEKNSSSDANKTQITLEKDNNISKEENENNTTELNATKQSSCQERLNSVLSKNKIHFAHNSSKIDKNSYPQLNQISTVLKECDTTFIVIDGYSDNSGEAQYNQLLSQQRANKVKLYLLSKGINKKSIKSFGHGAKNPLASNATKQGREQNRRIEFTIKKIK